MRSATALRGETVHIPLLQALLSRSRPSAARDRQDGERGINQLPGIYRPAPSLHGQRGKGCCAFAAAGLSFIQQHTDGMASRQSAAFNLNQNSGLKRGASHPQG